MPKSRLEAFSDGVIAILITIMVLEMKAPHGETWADLRPVLPVFAAYVMSFLYLGIYWSNHHHMLHTLERVTGSILWANLHLLFWLSLIPFATAWLGESHVTSIPTAVYGITLFASALAYQILQWRIIAVQGKGSRLRAAIGNDLQGRISTVGYFAAIILAYVQPWISIVIYAAIAALWLVPDRRIEREEDKR